MHDSRPLSIPVILGTPRQGRLSEHVARVIIEQATAREDVQTELIDVRQLPLTSTDAGEQIKDKRFAETIMRADGLIIVAPEYNHGYPGMLKHALDSNLKEYIHKPVGLCGVSAGGFGGTRVVESLLPVMRELGLVTIFWDVNVSSVGKAFDFGVNCWTMRYPDESQNSWGNWYGWRACSVPAATRSRSTRRRRLPARCVAHR